MRRVTSWYQRIETGVDGGANTKTPRVEVPGSGKDATVPGASADNRDVPIRVPLVAVDPDHVSAVLARIVGLAAIQGDRGCRRGILAGAPDGDGPIARPLHGLGRMVQDVRAQLSKTQGRRTDCAVLGCLKVLIGAHLSRPFREGDGGDETDCHSQQR